jgi:hypothetical protein
MKDRYASNVTLSVMWKKKYEKTSIRLPETNKYVYYF